MVVAGLYMWKGVSVVWIVGTGGVLWGCRTNWAVVEVVVVVRTD